MDKHFSASEQSDYPGLQQSDPSASSDQAGRYPSAWSGYPGQLREQEITQIPRFRDQPTGSERTPERRRSRFSPMFVVWTLLACLLIAATSSLATILLLRLPAFSPGRVNVSTPGLNPATSVAGQTPTPAVATLPSGSLYTAQAGAIYRFDLQQGQLQQPMQPSWRIQAAYPITPLIVGNKLFFEDAQTPGSFLEAADVHTGRPLWKNTRYGSGFLLSSGSMLYDAGCIDTMDNVGTTICTLDGIDAGTGARRWSYPLSGGSAWIALQNGVVYVVSYTSYFAVNATTGKLIWQRDLLRYTDQNANMTPAVSGNVLSFASCNVTKQSKGAPGCYLYAFNTSNGSELWHMYTTASIMVSPAIMDGVIYAGTVNGTLYALDEQSGKKLWTASVGGGAISQVLASAGTVYVEILASGGQTFYIEAFDAATHLPRWSQSQDNAHAFLKAPVQPAPLFAANHVIPYIPLSSFSAGFSENPFILNHGLVYLYDGSTTISVLNASNGSTITRYFVQNISGFAVVT